MKRNVGSIVFEGSVRQRMNPHGAYGDTMAERFNRNRADGFSVVHMNSNASFAVTRLNCGEQGLGRTQPIPIERAFVLVLLLRPLVRHKLWLGSRPKAVDPWRPGTVSVVDLEYSPSAQIDCPLDTLHFYLPRASLESVAVCNDTQAIRHLEIEAGSSDPVIHDLGQLMLPALQQPKQANNLFTSGLMTAFYAHILHTYSGVTSRPSQERGGLTPRQFSRAKEIIASNLAGTISLNDLATLCDLSPAHFARAFKRSAGVAPHRWLLIRRVEAVKQLLSQADVNGAEIASACGFADQSHMIRVFTNITGATPNVWRRQYNHIKY